MTVRSGSDTCPSETPWSPTETLRGRSTRSAPTPATVGTADTYAFAASGTPPIAFNVGSGGLPPGLTFALSGTLSGTLTIGGAWTFAVTVTGAAVVGPRLSSELVLVGHQKTTSKVTVR